MKPASGLFTKALLYLPARLYAAGVRLRLALYETDILSSHRLRAPVISVGNLTVGGTGKTPFVAFIAQLLQAEGFSAAILSRGYRRASRGRVEVSDGRSLLCDALSAGDEPYLLARACPGTRVVVDQDRYAAGSWLEQRAGIDAFILDDGFQHLQLARDLNLLLLDASDRPAQLRMIPQGRLREPLSSLRRADAIIITRADQLADRAAYQRELQSYLPAGAPVFFASHVITRLRRLDVDEYALPAALAHKPVAAVSGIARPERFASDLHRLGINIALRRDFGDHHSYSEQELSEIIGQAGRAGAAAVITTEKDAANLPGQMIRSSPLPVYAAQIEFRCEQADALRDLIIQRVRRK